MSNQDVVGERNNIFKEEVNNHKPFSLSDTRSNQTIIQLIKSINHNHWIFNFHCSRIDLFEPILLGMQYRRYRKDSVLLYTKDNFHLSFNLYPVDLPYVLLYRAKIVGEKLSETPPAGRGKLTCGFRVPILMISQCSVVADAGTIKMIRNVHLATKFF